MKYVPAPVGVRFTQPAHCASGRHPATHQFLAQTQWYF
jgi:hypothetical protein